MDIVKQIVSLLYAAFPGCEIYTEYVEQGFTTPCFSVRELDGAIEPFPSGRFRRMHSFDVRYFPKGLRCQEECRAVAEQLYSVLEYLPGYAARGTGMQWEITDKVLHFFVKYNLFVREVKQQDAMEELQTEVTT